MSGYLLLGGIFLLWCLTIKTGMLAGQRTYQIDLRIAHHQGRDLAEMVESESGYGDEE